MKVKEFWKSKNFENLRTLKKNSAKNDKILLKVWSNTKKYEIVHFWENCEIRTTRKYKDVEARGAWAGALKWRKSSWKFVYIHFDEFFYRKFKILKDAI